MCDFLNTQNDTILHENLVAILMKSSGQKEVMQKLLTAKESST